MNAIQRRNGTSDLSSSCAI